MLLINKCSDFHICYSDFYLIKSQKYMSINTVYKISEPDNTNRMS